MIDPFPRSENQNKLPKQSLVDPIRHHRINRQSGKIMLYIKRLLGNGEFFVKKGSMGKG